MTEESSAIAVESSARPSSAVGQILLISGNPAQADAIAQTLQSQKLPLLSCSSPEHAIESLASDSANNPRINMVLLDAGPGAKHIFPWLRDVTENLLAPLV